MTDRTLLFRQVHPHFVQEGRITSQVFRPTEKDDKQLSAYDGDLMSAENSWKHYTGNLGYLSVGVVGVSRSECESEGLGVTAQPEYFPEHVAIVFADRSESEVRRIASILKRRAEIRGWQYRA